MILSLQDMDHVSNGNLSLMALIRNDADPSGYDQHLVTLMSVPTGGAAFFKVNDTTVKRLTGTFWKELLAGALDVAACPSRDGRGCSLSLIHI